MLDDLMTEDILIIHEDDPDKLHPTEAKVSFQGRKIFAGIDIKAEEGDRLTHVKDAREYRISKVERFPAPRDDMSHTVLSIVSESEWERLNRRPAGPVSNTTWHVGSADVIAGRDIHGGVTVGITGPQLLEILSKQIEADSTIAPEEKKGLLQKLKDLATDPKIVGLAAVALGKGVRALLGLPSP